MNYVELEDCYKSVFPYIHEVLAKSQPAPRYEENNNGIKELGKVLALVKNDQYYPDLFDKAAYLICSVAGSQYFVNGNKRLGIALLLYFLIKNEVSITYLVKREDNVALFKHFFPKYRWSNEEDLGEQEFLYNLTKVIGDRRNWNSDSFIDLRERVSAIFNLILITKV